jgi:putative phage-type endonuclease
MEQGSQEWFLARCGKVTASRIADVVARTKSGWGASRANYMAQLIAERLTGTPAQTFTNAAMQHGTETEPLARAAYGFYCGQEVQEVGFIEHPTIEMSGASPDGLVADEGLIEIKCPNTATHIDTLLNGTIPKKYILQMQWQMACTERKWCDFVSFDPRLPEDLRMFVKRIDRDNDKIAELEKGVSDFLGEISEKIKRLEQIAA